MPELHPMEICDVCFYGPDDHGKDGVCRRKIAELEADHEQDSSRIVGWVSCGAASAAAVNLVKDEPGLVLARIHIATEHPDNDRFAADLSRWVGLPIIDLRSEVFKDPWEVFEKTRYLVGPFGARCTTELKKLVRRDFERPGDVHVFGFTAEKAERARFDRLRQQNPELNVRAPLIEAGLTKLDALQMLQEAGIEIPAMYRLGYRNNNCIGCVKGGAGYWNKLRVDFPKVFERMSQVEQSLGRTVLRRNGQPLALKDLNPTVGRYEPLTSGCDLLCG